MFSDEESLCVKVVRVDVCVAMACAIEDSKSGCCALVVETEDVMLFSAESATCNLNVHPRSEIACECDFHVHGYVSNVVVSVVIPGWYSGSLCEMSADSVSGGSSTDTGPLSTDLLVTVYGGTSDDV